MPMKCFTVVNIELIGKVLNLNFLYFQQFTLRQTQRDMLSLT